MLTKTLWSLVVLTALVLIGQGLLDNVYFENTDGALATARRGAVLVAVACVLLVLAAAYTVLVASWPTWIAVAVLVPVVLCGGLLLIVPQTLFPQLAALVAGPVALAGVLGCLLTRRRKG